MVADLMKAVLRFAVLMCPLILGVAAGGVSGGIAFAQELRLITSPWPPSNYLDEAGRPTGLSVAIVEALKQQLGVSTPIEVIPWARGYTIAQSDPNILLFTAAKTPERVKMGFEFIAPAIMWTHGLLARQGSTLSVDDLDDVRRQGLTVVGVRGSWQVKLLQDADIQTVEVEDHASSVRMLMAGRVDLWITSNLQASIVLKEAGVSATAARSIYTIQKSASYLMVSKGTDPELVARWRAAYEELKAGTRLQEIAKEWSEKLGIPLLYVPDEGFTADITAEGGTGWGIGRFV